MATEKMTYKEDVGAIYGEPANINYFLKTALTPDTETGLTNRSSSVKKFKRRRFAGDSASIDVEAHDRKWMYDPGRMNGSALPGHQFILDDGIERRQFHYTGPFIELHAFISGEAKMDLNLYSQSARYKIEEAAGGGEQRQR